MLHKLQRQFVTLYERAWAIGIVALAAVLPPAWLGAGPSLCLCRGLSGQSCPGCGMTTAFVLTAHARFLDAFHANRLVLVLFPVIFAKSILQLIALVRVWRASSSAAGPG